MGNYDGTVYTRETFKAHLDSIPNDQLSWIKFGVIHNTGAPNIAQQRATKGGAAQRMRNSKPDADKRLGGKGAHYWCFETGEIGKACPLPQKGAHSPSWNGSSFGIEMVADFRDKVDDPDGAGAKIIDTAAWVFAQIFAKLGIKATTETIKLHKEDKATTHDCPGNRVKKDKFVAKVQAYMGSDSGLTSTEKLGVKPTVETKPTFVQPSTLEIQKALLAAGFNPGPLDGLWGAKTKKAIQDFQTSKGLVPDAKVGPMTWAQLAPKPVEKPILAAPTPTKPIEKPAPIEAPKPVVADGLADVKPIGELHCSDFGLSWFKRFEGKGKPGKPFEAYDDRGTWAVGYGHNASSKRQPIPYEGMKITEAEADQILYNDTEAVKAEVRKVLGPVSLTQGQFDALVLDCFQRGQTQFTKTLAVQKIKEGDMAAATAAMYAQSLKTKDDGLKRRRLVEAQIFEGQKPTKW